MIQPKLSPELKLLDEMLCQIYVIDTAFATGKRGYGPKNTDKRRWNILQHYSTKIKVL